jgi:hypothetical protein
MKLIFYSTRRHQKLLNIMFLRRKLRMVPHAIWYVFLPQLDILTKIGNFQWDYLRRS